MKKTDAVKAQENAREPRWVVVIAVLAAAVVLLFHKVLLRDAFFWEDFLYFCYPVRSLAAATFASGALPLWNPYSFVGMPLLADVQTTVLYIPSLLLTPFAAGGHFDAYWLECMIIAHYILAGSGMALLATSYGMKRFPALVAGLVFSLSGFMLVHAIHQQIVTMVAWFPLIIWMFRRALSSPGWFWAFATAPVLGHMVFAGHPQMSLYGFFLLFIVFVFELLTSFRGKALVSRGAFEVILKAGLIAALAFAFTAIQVLPTMELAGLSKRAQMTFEQSSVGSLAWDQLATLFIPKVFGSAGAHGYSYFRTEPYWHYWETCTYIGVLPLLLAAFALRSVKTNTHVAFYAGLAAFALLYSLGNHFVLHAVFYNVVPGFSMFRNPGRMVVLFAFALAMLAGFGAQALLIERRLSRVRLRHVAGPAAIVGIGVLVWIATVLGMFDLSRNPDAATMIRKDALVALVMLGVATAVFGALYLRGAGTGVQWFVVGAIVLDLYVFGAEQNTAPVNPAEYFKRSSTLVSFFKHDGEHELFRVNTRVAEGMVMDRNQGMVDRLYTTEGYNPLTLQRLFIPAPTDQMLDLFNVKYRTVVDQARGSLSMAVNPTYLPRAFVVFAVHQVAKETEATAFIQSPAFMHRRMAVVESDHAPALAPDTTGAAGTARMLAYGPNAMTMEVEANRPAYLVVSEIFYPGWNAYIDGRQTEVFRTDYSLRGLAVPAGIHTVEMKFEPAPLYRGAAISFVALLACVGGMVCAKFRKGGKGKHD